MILAFVLAPKSLTLALASGDGQLQTTRDATWRVGSGRSVASAVAALLVDSDVAVNELTRVAVIDGGGSYTTSRTAYAYANTLAWTHQFPIVRVSPEAGRQLVELLQQASSLPPHHPPITPSYEPIP